MNTILVVEDDFTNFTLVEALLSQQGYRILHARDGRLVLDMMHSEHPDLVLLDMRLPGITGWDLAVQIKADPELAATPLIALTVQVTPQDRRRAMESGCDDYIAKPFDVRQLRDIVKRYLER